MKKITKKQVKELRALQIQVNRMMKDEEISMLSLPTPVIEYIRLANMAMTVLEDTIAE
jgi:hypothetical protein